MQTLFDFLCVWRMTFFKGNFYLKEEEKEVIKTYVWMISIYISLLNFEFVLTQIDHNELCAKCTAINN